MDGNNSMFNEPGMEWMNGGAAESLSSYTTKTFGWMGLGLLATFVTAYAGYLTGITWLLCVSMPYLPFILAIAEVITVIVLGARLHKLSAGGATALFFVYAILNGLTFSTLFLVYDVATMVYVFGLTALYFGVLAAYGYFTKRDLTGLRSFLFAGLLFLALYWVVSIFLPMAMYDKVVCFIGLAVFMGYTAYDTQMIKRYHAATLTDPDMAHKGAILCALQLYLDFINMFLHILRLVARKK